MALRRTVPPESLQVELEEVARSAKRFAAVAENSNVTLGEFPEGELLTIASALTRLPMGTGEGCRIPLEYARTRLPAIRREFFAAESLETETSDEDSVGSAPARGLRFDQSLTELIGAVATALDEYRRIARDAVDDSILDDIVANAPAGIAESIVARSAESLERLEHGRHIVDDVVLDTSSDKEKLSAQIVDAIVTAELAKAEIQMKPIFVRWMKAIGDELRRAPRRIQQLGRAIRVGVDVAQPLSKRWSDFWSNFEQFLLHELRALGDAIEQVGQTFEKGPKQEPASNGLAGPGDAFAQWLVRFIEDREVDGTGLPVTDVALGVQFQFRQRPRDFAKKMGQKTLTDLISSTPGVFLGSGVYGPRAILERNKTTYSESLDETFRRFKDEFEQFKTEHPTCSTAQLNKWLRSKFTNTSVLPTHYSSIHNILKSEGYLKIGKSKWVRDDQEV